MYGGFMVVTATVHVYFDDGTYRAVKVHNPEIEKYPAPEPLRRPVHFRYGDYSHDAFEVGHKTDWNQFNLMIDACDGNSNAFRNSVWWNIPRNIFYTIHNKKRKYGCR